jgi:hypothetical protein
LAEKRKNQGGLPAFLPIPESLARRQIREMRLEFTAQALVVSISITERIDFFGLRDGVLLEAIDSNDRSHQED